VGCLQPVREGDELSQRAGQFRQAPGGQGRSLPGSDEREGLREAYSARFPVADDRDNIDIGDF
jgi:hypothetical protein